MTEPDQPLPYLEVTDVSYAEKAAATFSVVEVGSGTVMLHGPCPRCQTIIDIPHVDTIFRSPLPGGSSDKHGEPMMCTCEDPHPNRPDGRYGCGAYWNLILSEQEQ